MSSFWTSLFGGKNDNLSSAINQSGQVGSFATGLGEQNLNAASQFNSALLGGNNSQVGKLLAPQIDTMQKQGQNQLNTLSQFGNRSGGTNATGQTSMDTSRSNIDNMISSLTASAAGNAGSLGSSLLGTGLEANNQSAQLSQIQMQNWSDSLFGLGITKSAGAGLSAALGAMTGGSV